jgi:hypothetical protein
MLEGEYIMKKLLILLMVLGMASFANAALTIEVYETDGSPYEGRILSVSDHVEIRLVASGGDTGDHVWALIANKTLGTLGGGAVDPCNPAELSSVLGSASSNYLGGMGDNDDGLMGQVGSLSASPYADEVYFSDILFHCESDEDTVVTLYDVTTTWSISPPDATLGSVTIYQPEPLTMSLLALGGLGILRRRR